MPDSAASAGFLMRLARGFFDGHYVDRSACDAAFARMHRRDAIGDRLHLVFACLGLVCLFGPVTLTEIAFGPLLVFFLVRVINTFPVWIHGFGQPAALSAIALSLWMMLSLQWSGDVALGWGEIAELRWFVLVGLIFPVIEKRNQLIAAMCVGVAFGQVGQLIDAFDGFGIDWLASIVENHPSRIGGWWHPVVGGSILVSTLGLALPSAMLGSGRSRTIGLVGALCVMIGILATGTRGAWLASAVLILVCVVFGLISKRIRWKHLLVLGVIGATIVLASGLVMRQSMSIRIGQAQQEIAQILDGDYDSTIGLRVKMAQGAIDATRAHPIKGVGAGGYQHWVDGRDSESGVHAHAHMSLLQVSSTLGLIGVGLWSVVLVAILRSAWRLWDRGADGIITLAPMLGIIGLMLASLTDSVQINTQTAALLGALAALCPAYHPQHPQYPQSDPQDASDK